MKAPESYVPPVVPVSQELVVNLMGMHVHGLSPTDTKRVEPLPAGAILDVLGRLNVGDSTTRSTLNRMVARGALVRHRKGRTSAYSPTETLLGMLHPGRQRMFSAKPFEHADEIWTILNCPIPESLRNTRYHVQARLTWAGFGMIQPNFWLAPGRIDVERLVGDIPSTHDFVRAFHGTPAAPSELAGLVESGWDLARIRAAHDGFARRWQHVEPSASEALPTLLQLVVDWGRLLRTDPGLPLAQDEETGPAERSTRIFQSIGDRIGFRAERSLAQLAAGQAPLGDA